MAPNAPGPSVSGDAVAHAARLGRAAFAGEILVAPSTRELAGGLIGAAPAPRVEGSAAWRLLGLVPDPAPLTRPLDTAMVGRGAELSQLRQAFDRVVDLQRLHLCTVLGTAGIGKSRLVEELGARVADEATVVAGRCIPVWRRNHLLAARRDGEAAGRRPAPRRAARRRRGWAPRFPSASRTPGSRRRGEQPRGDLLRPSGGCSTRSRAERPLVVVFEDIHWAEPTLLDFIEYLARGRDAMRR